MGKTKFTPGPWGFYLSKNTGLPPDPAECIVINTIGLPIPSTQPAICIITDKASLNDRDRANGLLIAAAPDMYFQLERISARPAEIIEMLRREGFVFDNLEDRWQKLAFSLYTALVELGSESESLLARARGEDL